MSCICSIVDNAVASEAKDRRFESYQVHIVKNEKSPVNGALFLLRANMHDYTMLTLPMSEAPEAFPNPDGSSRNGLTVYLQGEPAAH